MFFPVFSGQLASISMLVGSAVAGYIASRAAQDAIVPMDRPAPGRRAAVHAAMAAIISVAAVIRRPALLDVAVGVPFSASIAASTLALGVVAFVAMPAQGLRRVSSSALAAQRRIWAFVLPTALLTMLIGFSGELAPRHAVMLVIEGIALLALWSGTVPENLLDAQPPIDLGRRVVQLLLAGGLAVVSGLAAVEAASGLALHNEVFRPGVAAAVALGPAVVLPMIPPLATLAENGRRDEAISAVVLFVLANLCAVLPLVITVQQLSVRLHPVVAVAAADSEPTNDTLAFPMVVWRLDAVLLVVIGLLILPAAAGRSTISRGEGAALTATYVAYLFLTLLLSHGG